MKLALDIVQEIVYIYSNECSGGGTEYAIVSRTIARKGLRVQLPLRAQRGCVLRRYGIC